MTHFESLMQKKYNLKKRSLCFICSDNILMLIVTANFNEFAVNVDFHYAC